MIFASYRWPLSPGYAKFYSDYCSSNSSKLSDDCKMGISCMYGRETKIARCYRYGWRLESGTCYGSGFKSSSLCTQNLRGKTLTTYCLIILCIVINAVIVTAGTFEP